MFFLRSVVAILLLSLFASPVLGELTTEDLQKIHAMVDKSETRLKEHVDLKIQVVNTRLNSLDKRLDNQQTWMFALFAFLAVVVTAPYVIIAYYGKRLGQFNTELTTVKNQAAQYSEQSKEVVRLAQEVHARMQEHSRMQEHIKEMLNQLSDSHTPAETPAD